MKKMLKVLFAIVITFSVLFCVAQPVSLAAVPDATATITEMENSNSSTDTTQITSIGGTVVNVITTVAIVVSVVVLTVIGIKYIIGSTQEKAEYKKSLIPLVVGILVIIFASTIVKFLFSIKVN